MNWFSIADFPVPGMPHMMFEAVVRVQYFPYVEDRSVGMSWTLSSWALYVTLIARCRMDERNGPVHDHIHGTKNRFGLVSLFG